MNQLSEEKLNIVKAIFAKADEAGSGFLELKELREALKLVNLDLPGYQVRDLESELKKSDQNRDGKLSLDEFQHLYSRLKRESEQLTSFRGKIKPLNTDVKLLNGNKTESMQSVHFVKDSEKEAFCKWINQNLKEDPDLHLSENPLDPIGIDLFVRCTNGVLLCKLINLCVPNIIEERLLNKGNNLHIFQKLENLELALRSAESIGCHIVNIRPKDIHDAKEYLILGLIWQIILIGLFSEKTLAGLMFLKKKDENSDDMLEMSKEELHVRWVNYQLKQDENDNADQEIILTEEPLKLTSNIESNGEQIRGEVEHQMSLCQCPNRFSAIQVSECQYRFGSSQMLRLVRILKSTVMVRVGGGWIALDEFLVKNDPCRTKRRTKITLQGNFLVTETFCGTYQQKPPAKPKRAFANRKSCSRDSSLNRADKHQTLIKQVNSENKRLSASTSDLSSIGIRKQYKPSKLPVYQRQGENICR